MSNKRIIALLEDQLRLSLEREMALTVQLRQQSIQIEELTADIKAQIEKLKEYRKIVIHDAVTGKIKVTEGE